MSKKTIISVVIILAVSGIGILVVTIYDLYFIERASVKPAESSRAHKEKEEDVKEKSKVNSIQRPTSRPSCSNECSEEGSERCLGGGRQACGDFNEDGCLEWSSAFPCREGYICQGGRCVRESCGGVVCSKFQECVKDRCILTDTPYKMGLVYIYNDQDTYNSDWREKIKVVLSRVEEGVGELTEGKVDVSIDILGEMQTDIFCWNPAKLGIKYRSEGGTVFYAPLPGSSFEQVSGSFGGTILELDCDKCKVKEEEEETPKPGDIVCEAGNGDWETAPGQCNSAFKPFYCDGSTGELLSFCSTCGCPEGLVCNKNGGCGEQLVRWQSVSIDCEHSLSLLIDHPDRMELLKQKVSQKLSFKFSNYDGVFVIFGRFGPPVDSEKNFLRFACQGTRGVVGGYSSLMMSENFIIEPRDYFVDCSKLGAPEMCTYQKVGWHAMVHEILHRFGAIDVYDTSSMFGIPTYKQKALEMDSKVDESVMGNDDRDCVEKAATEGDICSDAELERLYLDKYNRQKVGL